MPKILLHCLNAKERPTVMAHAQSEKLHAKTPHEHNPHSIELNGDTQHLESFAKHYENNPNFAILYDHDHPKAGKDKLKPHFRRHKHELKAEMTAHSTYYGNTCNVWKQYYNYPTQNGTAPVIAVISLGGSFKGTDLVYYWQTVLGYSSWANVLRVSVENANPSFTGSGDDTENTLDLEIAGGMCPGATIIFYSAPNTDIGFYYAINQAISGSTINGKFYQPTIISCSWGAAENYYTTSTMNAFDQLFQTGINKGITTCAASGDYCATDGETDGQPHADFPASSPNVVSCGGTTASGIETAWSHNATYGWGTGGGISSIFPEPAYQVGTVIYPTGTTPSVTNLAGKRASPDIAMNADPLVGWTIYFNGRLEINGTGGTSCVAPAMAGLLGLMNLSYPNGFNTHLYNVHKKQAYCFKDITTGSNDNITNSKGVYNAGVGYDCCTGLGSIRGTYLFNALKSGL